MIISKKYAKLLIAQGKATNRGYTRLEDGSIYVIIDRLDIQRTDRYCFN